MPRNLDHLVLCVHDLEAAHRRFRSFGFTVTPPADHPFGTRNRLVLLDDNFIELLTVADAGAIPSTAPGGFSFGAHNRTFLAEGEGISMLAFKGTDARADVRGFAAQGLATYDPLDFSRDAVMPDGRTVRVGFSLAFSTDAGLPGLAFFTCQHQQSRDLFWQPDYQRHANGAKRVVDVVLSAADPGAHRHFFERLTGSYASAAPGMLSFGPPDNRLTLSGRARFARGFPEGATDRRAPHFEAYRVAIADLGTVERHLQENGVRYQSAEGAIVIAPTAAFGVAIEFTSLAGQ
jgi:hypothetical protein